MNGFLDGFRFGHDCRIQRGLSPGDIDRQSGEVDHAALALIATEVVRAAHENAVDRARFHAEGTEKALRVIDRKPSDLKAFTAFDFFFSDIDAVDRADFSALIAGDARREIKPMKPAIPIGYLGGLLGVLIMFGKCPTCWIVGLKPNSQRCAQGQSQRNDGGPKIPKPLVHLGFRACPFPRMNRICKTLLILGRM